MIEPIPSEVLIANMLIYTDSIALADLKELQRKLMPTVYFEIDDNSITHARNVYPSIFRETNDSVFTRVVKLNIHFVNKNFNWRIPKECRSLVISEIRNFMRRNVSKEN